MKNENKYTMKKTATILIAFVFIAGGCNQATSKEEKQAEIGLLSTPRTIDIACDSCALFIRPTVEQIEQIKSTYQDEEHFYIMADDASFYTANAIEYLESKNVDIFYLDSIKNVCFNKKDTFDFSNLAWDFVLYKKNKTPKTVPAIDLKYEFKRYFNTNESTRAPSENQKNDRIFPETDYTLKDLEDKNVLQDIEWFNVADILSKNPVNIENVVKYNNAAFYLIEYNKYNEARLILLEITEKYPDRVVAWLNLADAQWGFDDKDDAKHSYNKYIEQMKSQRKDLNKIPQRVYDRIK